MFSRHQTNRTRQLWWQGLPSTVRGRVWQLAIGNELNITRGEQWLGVQRNRKTTPEACVWSHFADWSTFAVTGYAWFYSWQKRSSNDALWRLGGFCCCWERHAVLANWIYQCVSFRCDSFTSCFWRFVRDHGNESSWQVANDARDAKCWRR